MTLLSLTRRIGIPPVSLWAVAILCVAGPARAQSVADIMSMQRGYFRGQMVRWEGTAAVGDLVARNAEGELYACGYDAKTYMEMARRRISVAKLEPGDPLEILADRKPGSRACYVRTVNVVAPKTAPRTTRIDSPKAAMRPRDPLPRGDRTISGLVVRVEGAAMTLRTREGDVALLLRRDTRYYSDAQSVGVEGLHVNTRVSARVGPTLDGDLQVYQVNWGGIVTVR